MDRRPTSWDRASTAIAYVDNEDVLRAVIRRLGGREALKALLTDGMPLDNAAAAFSALDHSEADLPYAERSGPYEYATFILAAAVDALDSPKGDT